MHNGSSPGVQDDRCGLGQGLRRQESGPGERTFLQRGTPTHAVGRGLALVQRLGQTDVMVRKHPSTKQTTAKRASAPPGRPGRPSALLDTRIVYCGECLDHLRELPDRCVDPIYIDPPFNSNGSYDVFWGETKEFEDRHATTQAYIDHMRPRCVELRHVLRTTGPFRLGKLSPTPYHALRMTHCLASVGSGAAFCRENV